MQNGAKPAAREKPAARAKPPHGAGCEKLRLDTGERTTLKLADRPLEGPHIQYVLPWGRGPLYRIDPENRLIDPEPLKGGAIPDIVGADRAWLAYDEEQGNSLLIRADRERGIVEARLKVPPAWPIVLMDQWLVSGSSYIRIP